MWTDGIMDKDASESGNSSPFKELETFLFVHQFLFLFFCWGGRHSLLIFEDLSNGKNLKVKSCKNGLKEMEGKRKNYSV